jgi:hypothetical protein
MDRASSKHGPQRDDEMEREDREITHTAEPEPGPEWRQTEPFDEPDIAVYVQPHKLPAERGAILDYARHEGAPDEVLDALGRLPARTVFHTIGEVVRAIGIPTEEPRDHTDG